MPQGRTRDEGMHLEVLEEELLEKDLRVMLTVFEKDHRAEAQRRHKEITVLVASMVQRGSTFSREATRKTRAVESEIYSAPRVTEAAARHARLGAIPGLALAPTAATASRASVLLPVAASTTGSRRRDGAAPRQVPLCRCVMCVGVRV